MVHPHELVVRGAYEALDRDDMAGFAASFAADAVRTGARESKSPGQRASRG